MPENNMSIDLRLAVAEDIGALTHCVCQAFIDYIPRIGRQPGPMLDDYRALVERSVVTVACRKAKIIGVLVLLETEEGFCIETIAVLPDEQGLGLGARLMSFAEITAKQLGYTSIYLSTHRLMVESQAMYAHLGYLEFDQRIVNGFDRVFVRKQLQ